MTIIFWVNYRSCSPGLRWTIRLHWWHISWRLTLSAAAFKSPTSSRRLWEVSAISQWDWLSSFSTVSKLLSPVQPLQRGLLSIVVTITRKRTVAMSRANLVPFLIVLQVVCCMLQGWWTRLVQCKVWVKLLLRVVKSVYWFVHCHYWWLIAKGDHVAMTCSRGSGDVQHHQWVPIHGVGRSAAQRKTAGAGQRWFCLCLRWQGSCDCATGLGRAVLGTHR